MGRGRLDMVKEHKDERHKMIIADWPFWSESRKWFFFDAQNVWKFHTFDFKMTIFDPVLADLTVALSFLGKNLIHFWSKKWSEMAIFKSRLSALLCRFSIKPTKICDFAGYFIGKIRYFMGKKSDLTVKWPFSTQTRFDFAHELATTDGPQGNYPQDSTILVDWRARRLITLINQNSLQFWSQNWVP